MRLALVLMACLLLLSRVSADPDHCAVCGAALSGTIYLATDKVTNEKKQICQSCSALVETCFVCGLPVKTDYNKLPDGRLICARDAQISRPSGNLL